MLQTDLQIIKNLQNVSTEESNWESKLILHLDGAELVTIDALHVILFISQYFPIFSTAMEVQGERTFLKNERKFILSDFKL